MAFGSTAFASLAKLGKMGAKTASKPSIWSRLGKGSAQAAANFGDEEAPYKALGAGIRSKVGGETENPLYPEPDPAQRFRGLFQEPPAGENISDIPEEPDQASRYFEEMQRIRGQSPALGAYREHVSKMPTREEYNPSKMRRLLAALGGGAIAYGEGAGAGMGAAEEFKERPYSRAIESYKMKGDMLGEQAGMEQDDMNAQLRSLQQARALGLNYDKFELQRQETAARMSAAEQNAGSNRMRAEAYARAQGRPRHQYKDVEEGILEINQDTGEQRVIPAKTLGAGQLNVSRGNAATSRRNAATSERNATTSEGNLANSVRRTNIYGESSRGRTDGNLTPATQKAARELALDEMFDDPQWSRFLAEGADQSDFTPEEYSIFQDSLQDRIQDILSRKRR